MCWYSPSPFAVFVQNTCFPATTLMHTVKQLITLTSFAIISRKGQTAYLWGIRAKKSMTFIPPLLNLEEGLGGFWKGP